MTISSSNSPVVLRFALLLMLLCVVIYRLRAPGVSGASPIHTATPHLLQSTGINIQRNNKQHNVAAVSHWGVGALGRWGKQHNEVIHIHIYMYVCLYVNI